jgi:predicted RNA-binding protein
MRMCEVRVIIEDRDGTVEQTLDDVATIIPSDDSLTLVDLFGGRTSVKASFKEVKLLDHTVVLSRDTKSPAAVTGGSDPDV